MSAPALSLDTDQIAEHNAWLETQTAEQRVAWALKHGPAEAAMSSSFGAQASKQAEQLIDEASPWWPIRDGIRARANASQDNPTPASHFARNLLAAVQNKPRPLLLRLGNGSRALPLLAAPAALLARSPLLPCSLPACLPPPAPSATHAGQGDGQWGRRCPLLPSHCFPPFNTVCF